MSWVVGWILGFVGLAILAFRHPAVARIKADIWGVHYDKCAERYGKNAALLMHEMCDKGANELAFRGKVDCELARAENAWGIELCTLQSLIASNSLADAARYARDSWPVFIFILVVTSVCIRSYWNHRATLAIHQATLKSLADASAAMHNQQQHHHGRNNQMMLPHYRSMPQLTGGRQQQQHF